MLSNFIVATPMAWVVHSGASRLHQLSSKEPVAFQTLLWDNELNIDSGTPGSILLWERKSVPFSKEAPHKSWQPWLLRFDKWRNYGSFGWACVGCVQPHPLAGPHRQLWTSSGTSWWRSQWTHRKKCKTHFLIPWISGIRPFRPHRLCLRARCSLGKCTPNPTCN